MLLDFTTLNANLNIISAVRIVLLLPVTGGAFTSSYATSIYLNARRFPSSLTFELVMGLLLIQRLWRFFTMKEYTLRHFLHRFVRDGWLFLEAISIILFITMLVVDSLARLPTDDVSPVVESSLCFVQYCCLAFPRLDCRKSVPTVGLPGRVEQDSAAAVYAGRRLCIADRLYPSGY